MAKRRGPKNYKQVRTLTKNMGGDGGQEHVLAIKKLDPQLAGAYLNNVIVSMQLNESSESSISTNATPGFTAYLTSSGGAWSDDNIISARSFGGSGGTCSLSAKRYIKSDETDETGTTGPVHVWVEMTDIVGVLETSECRVNLEVWGRFIALTVDSS
jgi:hypothetical protein